MNRDSQTPAVCDYEGSPYRTEFWENQDRNYEDQVERVALRRLLPAGGRRLLELGAGFGRLTNQFSGYEQVILLDYSRSLLAEAQERLGQSERFVYVAANIYQLPIADGVCDAATLIRVIHHLADAPAALKQIRATLAPGSMFVLEFANKRNLKAVLRHRLGMQDWSPYSLEPYEFVELNFNFHPQYIKWALEQADFETRRRLAVSYFRVGALKRLLPDRLLVGLDALLQPTGGPGSFSPSVFTQNVALGESPPAAFDGPLFKCPQCGSTMLSEEDERIGCETCEMAWSTADGIYDFREPIS
jgi:ubiquinone/menaquinone biosynthesis C-methylase UbiE